MHDRTRGDGFQLPEGRVRLDIRNRLFTVRGVRPWNRSREAVAAPSMKVLEARLDRTLSNLAWWKVSLSMPGAWHKMTFKVPSNTKHSVILILIIRLKDFDSS